MLYGTILCLGDSLTFGARAKLGYPEVLPTLINDKSDVEWATLNRGISGQTTRQILDRTPGAVRELNGLSGAKWGVLLAGTNDAKRNGVNIDEWEIMYRQIVHWFRRYEVPLALCTFPRLASNLMPSFHRGSNDWLYEASERVRKMTREYDARLVELTDLDDAPDGVHLSPRSYASMAERIADELGLL